MTALPERTASWCQALFFAGSTTYMWNQAPELKALFLTACSFEEGMDVLLIGKFLEESGLVSAVESILRSWGNLRVVDLAPQVVAAWRAAGVADEQPSFKWDLDCFDELRDGSLDRVVLFNAASHVADWEHLSAQIGRVLCRGGRVVVAEAPLGGAAFKRALAFHAGWRATVEGLLSGLDLEERAVAPPEPEDLRALLAQHMTWARVHEWQGIFICYGQKGLTEREELEASTAAEMAGLGENDLVYVPGPDTFTAFPPANIWVRSFLKVRPVRTTWSLMSELEKEIWADTAVELVTHSGGDLSTNKVLGLSLIVESPQSELASQTLVLTKPAAIGDALGGFSHHWASGLVGAFLECFLGPDDGHLAKVGETHGPSELGSLVARHSADELDLLFVDARLGDRHYWKETISLLLPVLKPGGRLVLFAEDGDAIQLLSFHSAFARLLLARLVTPADPLAADSADALCNRLTGGINMDPELLRQVLAGFFDEISVAGHGGFVFVSGRKPMRL
ncbi:MAG: methyltransferase domain-containing protein [Thermoleophilia bacterium]|nr:methyltransferase domain-containing protein [Thermoleophilia bacterium]